MRIFALCLFITGVLSSPHPQDVSVDDVFGGDGGDATRYSAGGQEEVKGDVLAELDGYNTVKEIVDDTSDDCSYYASDGYSCVPYYNCEDGEIVTDGGGLIDIRSNFGSVLDPGSSKCPGFLEVCCRHPDFSTNAPTEKPIIKSTLPPPPPYQPQCGRRNIDGIGVRIQNDKYKGTTQFGEWPHMCAVLEKKAVGGQDVVNLYKCGASLIAPGIVLTAAHCVDKLDAHQLKVRCGEWDTQQIVEPQPHEDRDVREIVKDPLFDPRNLQNDFALLILDHDFVLKPHIDTICLPKSASGIHSYLQNNCVATGWGKDKFGKQGEYQVVMKQVEMDIVNDEECQRRLRRTRLGNGFELHHSFICAGGEKGKDTCKGDGGGPLVCPVNVADDPYGSPTYIQAGIVAWGIDCGVDGNPGVYAGVADGLCFMNWAAKCSGYDLGILDCENWAYKRIESLRARIASDENRFKVISEDGSGTPSNLRNLQRKIRKETAKLKIMEAAIGQCDPNNGYKPSGTVDEVDLSSLGRDGYGGGDNSGVEAVVVEKGDGYDGQDGTYVEPVIVAQGEDGYVEAVVAGKGDGYVEAVVADQNGDGYVDGVVVDKNGDGYVEEVVAGKGDSYVEEVVADKAPSY